VKTLAFCLAFVMTFGACAYPKDPVTIPIDEELNTLEGFTTRAEVVPMSICVDPEDVYKDELVQLAHFGARWWNHYLETQLGCKVFEVDTRNDTHLFCDIILHSAIMPPGVSGYNDGWWSRRSNPPGVFYRSKIFIDRDAFSRPDYLKGVTVHELGHCFGLADDPGASMQQLGSVMSSPLPREYRPTVQDLHLILQNARCDQ
jgi:hypothetical protein